MNNDLQSEYDGLMETYIGDPETGLLHRTRSACRVSNGVFYLNWRTALIHGYSLCQCCRAQAASVLIALPGGA
ncbi:hypothetical protein [Kallotenue papyrolyticum]|uniref:hypothetical protein n=1 Tax=Kallotenue papyrolyticum TaxID=1325125 RepID=UPI000492CE68|nr:hypothetical protein [Kallotenue papyrolyticum]